MRYKNTTKALTLAGVIAFPFLLQDNTYAASNEVEPNNSIEESNYLKFNELTKSLFENQDDQDFYKFTVTKTGHVEFQFNAVKNYDVDVQLFDSDGKVIETANRYVDASKTSTIVWGLKPGEYTIRLKSTSYLSKDIAYQFTAKFIERDKNSLDIAGNYDFKNATYIDINKEVNATYNSKRDDYFTFTVDTPSSTYITFDFNFKNTNTYITLYDENEKEIFKPKNYKSGLSLKKGKYFLKVNFWIPDESEAYSFRISQSTVTSFSDIPKNHPYYNEISLIREMGIINGYNDGTFRPNELIKRKNLASMIVRSGADLQITRMSTYFYDVKESHPNYSEIMALYKAGIIDGDNKGYFNPDGSLTRAQLAKILVNSFKLEERSISPVKFSDVKSSDWYSKYAMIIGSYGINVGTPGKFEASKPVTRAEFAVMVYRTIKALEMN